MIFLGIDTSTPCGTVALASNDGLVAEYDLNIARTHSTRLLSTIDKILTDTAMHLRQIDGLAVSLGPGSFTGLRIGIATAKALALAIDKPLVGIPTLDVLAENAHYCSTAICPTLGARKGELFAALYRRSDQGTITRCTEYLSIWPDALLERIHEPVLFLGNAVRPYMDALKSKSPFVALAPAELHYPRASVLCRLALDKWKVEGGVHPRDLQAVYVRATEAELHRSS